MAEPRAGTTGWRNSVLVLVFGFIYTPIAVLIILSFNDGGSPTLWTGFSFKWYAALLRNQDILGAALNTLIVAVSSTIIATILGTLLAVGMETRRRKGRALEAFVFSPMIIPDIVLAIALLSFFSMLNIPLGLYTIVLAHVVFNIAFVSSVVRARLKRFDWTLTEASADLGASNVTTFRRITLPLILPAVVAGALLAFTLSVDEFIIAFFTSGAGRESTTLPMQIFAMVRFGVTPELNALATMFMLVSVAVLAFSQWLNRGRESV